MKTCIECKKPQELQQFGPVQRTGSKEYWRKKCRTCRAKAAAKKKQPKDQHCKGCKKTLPISKFELHHGYRYKTCMSCRGRASMWLHRYGITPERYQEMLDAQGGVCAICKNPEARTSNSGQPFRLAVDHDHSCCPGKTTCGSCIRGLLCRDCNQALGLLRDDLMAIQRALDYLSQ